jgi:uroporphyrinogen decarboxylase
LAATPNTGIHHIAYRNLLTHWGLDTENVAISNLTLQLGRVSEEMLRKLGVDVRGFWTNPPEGWKQAIRETESHWTTVDEFGLRKAMPKRCGLYYDAVERPLSGTMTLADLDEYAWPDFKDRTRLDGLRKSMEQHQAANHAVLMNTFYVGILEFGEYLRGYHDFFIDLAKKSPLAIRLLDIATELRMQYWETVLEEVGDLTDVVAENDDLGTQTALMISPQTYRTLIKPRHRKLFEFIRKKAPHVHIHFHSCGAIRELIWDLIEVGVQSLNPVQVSATNMDTKSLKREFGKALAFWGGGVDTQHVLPYGTPTEVRDEVKRRIDDLASDGGFVFSAVHSIQPDVPPENFEAMWEALQDYGAY